MMKIVGKYEWKLINSKDGSVESSGEQTNLVTDNAISRILGNGTPSGRPWNTGSSEAYIFVSSTTPSLIDYRDTTSGMAGLAITAELIETSVVVGGFFRQSEVNFSAPGSPRTIRVIGLKNTSGVADLLSFIELTTPITQQVTQLLFVRYRVECAYTGVGENGIFNSFVTTKMNRQILTGNIFNNSLNCSLTPFKKPTNLNLCGRTVNGFANNSSSIALLTRTRQDSKLAYKFETAYTTSQIPGVFGSMYVSIYTGSTYGLNSANASGLAIPQFPDDTTIGTVFAHAAGDQRVFSNPSMPPNSKGNVLLTGTSTSNKHFKKISFEITQSGEANDTPDVNTGKFKYGINTYIPVLRLDHINPLVLDGTILENVHYVNDNNPPDNYNDGALLLRWFKYAPNDFAYFGQIQGSNQFICKWRFNTLESGIEVLQLNGMSTAEVVGNIIWIATSNGLVKFDTTTDTILDTFTTSDGLLSNDCVDLAYDDVNDIIWIGHQTGLTKFELSGDTVVSTHTTSSSPFNTLTANQIRVFKGQLSARDGYVCRGGSAMATTSDDGESPWVYDNNTNTLLRIPRSNFTNSRCRAVTLVGDGTGNIIIDHSGGLVSNGAISEWNVNPFGGTFSLNQGTTYTFTGYSASSVGIHKLVRISNNQFMGLGSIATVGCVVFDYRRDNNTAIGSNQDQYYANSNSFGFSSLNSSFEAVGSDKNSISSVLVDGVMMIFFAGALFSSVRQQLYGWTGSSWDKNSTGSMDIPDSPIISLENGINVNFENAIGFPANQQFVSGENFMFVTGPGRVKSNLQTMTAKAYWYMGDMVKIIDRAVTIPDNPGPYTYTLPETSNDDFKALETDSDFIVVKNPIGPVIFTQVPSAPALNQYSVTEAGVFTFNSGNANLPIEISCQFIYRH